jgi:hypothetical protein
MVLIYGANCRQLSTLQRTLDLATVSLGAQFLENKVGHSALILRGALKNVKAEIEAGLIGSFRQQVAGDVLSDFIKLARTALDRNGDDAKNVAAVLAAAAFEDSIRRMGVTLAKLRGDEELQDILIELKNAGVMQSPQIGIAQSYLSFRNHALHANWNKIQRESVQSALGFTEQLLLRHFQ